MDVVVIVPWSLIGMIYYYRKLQWTRNITSAKLNPTIQLTIHVVSYNDLWLQCLHLYCCKSTTIHSNSKRDMIRYTLVSLFCCLSRCAISCMAGSSTPWPVFLLAVTTWTISLVSDLQLLTLPPNVHQDLYHNLIGETATGTLAAIQSVSVESGDQKD